MEPDRDQAGAEETADEQQSRDTAGGGRGPAVVLGLLVAAAVLAGALIGWDLTRSRSSEVDRTGGGSAVPGTGAVERPADPSVSPSTSVTPARSVKGARRTGGPTGGSAADRAAQQAADARRARDNPQPRPPVHNPITQDDLDRERQKGETVPPVTVVEPTP